MLRLVALVVLFSVTSCSRVSYCGSKMCGHTNAHTFCQFPEGPSPRCTGYIEAPLTNEDKVRLLARLNRRRSEAASGRLRGLPPAGNMLKLRWVEELAREAQRWADQCRPANTPEERDVCRDLYSTTVGQCVASVVGEAPGLRVESMIDLWHMQAILYKGNVTSYIPTPSNGAYYSDFGQILWSRTYMVGCGRSRFMAPWRGRLRSTERLVCNFAPRGPPAARELWIPGPAAAACSPRSLPDRILTALCTYQPESINNDDIDNSMALEEYVTLNTVLEIESNESLNFHGSLDELYLTKMAMLTMNNMVISTEYYNNVQKRDIADIVLLEDAKADVYKIAYERDLQNISLTDNLPQVQVVAKPPKLHKKKVSLIGRPKTYNMEDLNDVKHENVHNFVMEESSRNEKDLYTDYEFEETDDVSDTTVEPKILFLTSDAENIDDKNVNKVEISTIIQELVTNVTLALKNHEYTLFNNTMRTFYNASKPVENMEDYLNDSETVRELQEALERMERTLGPKLIEGQGKVKRDLREFTEKIKTDDNAGYQETNSVSREVERNNKTDKRGPMMSMVLKYMPYLKQYESDILGTSGTSCICPGFVLMLTLFFS